MIDLNTNLLNPFKKIVIPYFIFGVLWILFSDTVVVYLLDEYLSYQTIQSVKGVLFVLITGIFLFFLLKNNLRELKEKEQRLYKLAYYDELTDLPNKKYLYHELDHLISKNDSADNKEEFSLFFININNFNTLTDIKGTSHGSEIIEKISNKLKKFIRENSESIPFLSSYNYNKFILIIKGKQEREKLKSTAEKIISSLSELWEEGTIDYYLNLDIGISRFPDSGQNAEDLISAAKIAANNIDDEDNNIKCYDHKMFSDKLEYENLKRDLREAVKKDQFEVYYQPKVKIPEEEIIGFEALLRWRHHELGMISPLYFINIAEETGFIREIGEWVLKRVLSDIQNNKDKFADKWNVSINLSPLELYDRKKAEKIAAVFNEYQLNNEIIEFEITENALLDDKSSTLFIINNLKKMKFSIALDDFGIGYSSLSYLSRLPIDTLKIDKTFVDNINKEKNRILIKSIIELAHNLNLEVIAEGVEEKEQLEILKQFNCDKIQGYYYYRPLPLSEVLKII